MKKIIHNLSIFILILFLSNCDSPTENENTHELVGSWNWIQSSFTTGSDVDIQVPDDDNYQVLTFNQDGVFTFLGLELGEELTGNGTWTTNGNTLEIKQYVSESDGEWTSMFNYSITNNILTMTMTTEGDVTTITEMKYEKQ